MNYREDYPTIVKLYEQGPPVTSIDMVEGFSRAMRAAGLVDEEVSEIMLAAGAFSVMAYEERTAPDSTEKAEENNG